MLWCDLIVSHCVSVSGFFNCVFTAVNLPVVFLFKAFAACFSISSWVIFYLYIYRLYLLQCFWCLCRESLTQVVKISLLLFDHPFYLLLMNGFMCFNQPSFVFSCFWASSKDDQGFQSKWQMLTRDSKRFNLTLIRFFPPAGKVFWCNIRLNYITVYLLISLHSVLLKHEVHHCHILRYLLD